MPDLPMGMFGCHSDLIIIHKIRNLIPCLLKESLGS